MPRPASVNTAYPINWSHPLNRGLVSWWLPLRYGSGGTRLRDLCGRNHAALTNGPSWTVGSGRHVVDCDGSEYVQLATSGAAHPGSVPWTVTASMIPVTAPAAFDTVDVVSFGFARVFHIWETGGKLGTVRAQLVSGGGFWIGSEITGSTTWTYGSPTFYHLTYTNPTFTLTIRNLLGESDYVTGSPGSSYENRPLECFALKRTGSNTWGGQFASASIHRGIVPFLPLYEQWKSNYPDTLNRSRRVFKAPAIGGGGGKPMYAYQQQ